MTSHSDNAQPFLTTEQFRSLVDVFLPDLDGIISASAGKSEDSLMKELRAHFPDKIQRFENHQKRLSDGLLLDHIADGKPLGPYRGLTQTIRDSLRRHESQKSGLIEGDWHKAIPIALALNSLRSENSENEMPVTLFSAARPQALAEASKWIRNQGYRVAIENGSPVLSLDDREAMALELQKMIRNFGPLNVIYQVILELSIHRSDQMERYLDPPRFVRTEDTRISYPFPANFVIQLAIKNLGYHGPHQSNAERWLELVNFSSGFAAIHDVWVYDQYENLFRNAASVRDYIVDLALADRFFRPKQLGASYIPLWVEGLFDWVGFWPQAVNGWSIKTAVEVSKIILELSNSIGPTLLKKFRILEKCCEADLNAAEVQNFLGAITHPSIPNQELTLPYIPTTITFGKHPLIKISPCTLLLIDPAICGFSFYEAVATAIRAWDPKTQNEIGFAAERLLHRKLLERGITARTGTYKYGKKRLECDCVVETDDCIIFIEQKGKVLTEVAQTGGDVDIFTDLLGAFFSSISQCYQHEIALRAEGKISLLQADGTVHEIELNGRIVEKIGASLLDFGRFNDRAVISQLLRIFAGAEIVSLHEQGHEKVSAFNRKIQILRARLQYISELTNENRKDDPILSSWFLSLQQLLIISDGVGNNKEFQSRLFATRHITIQSNDWYTEDAYKQHLEKYSREGIK